MDSKTRMETAWAFKEADRVPIELRISARAKELPEARRLAEFEANEADNFFCFGPFDWGFLGLDSEYSEEVIEDVPGEFKRIKRTHSTPAGVFWAITRHTHGELDAGDYHWERRYIDTIDEFERVAKASRRARPFDANVYEADCAKVGDRGIAQIWLQHPLGNLVRKAKMEAIYAWLLAENELVHAFLESCASQLVESVRALDGRVVRPAFLSAALEMLTPPWLGRDGFEEFVFPYDKRVNDAIHAIGGRHRAHCHGNSGQYLDRFAEMGIDAIEPLEPPPYGDNDLARAKREVSGRMLLSGNIPSQNFLRMSEADIRQAVKEAIQAGAPGGGFTLCCTGGGCGTGGLKSIEQLHAVIPKVEAYLDAAIEYGQYPIKT